MNNRKGFTLVELLATIAILGLVIGLSTYGIIKLINNSKEEAHKVTSATVKEAARLYSSEASPNEWKDINDYDYKYFCVTIRELINKGFLKKEDIENASFDTNTYIAVKKNRITETIDKEEFVKGDGTDPELEGICEGNIRNEVITSKPELEERVKYTDQIDISFTDAVGESTIKEKQCYYGKSTNNINAPGKILDETNCSFENLEHNKDYYVKVCMTTERNSTVCSTPKNIKTYEVQKPEIIQTESSNVITIEYDDSHIREGTAEHYLHSTIAGTTNKGVYKCELIDKKFNCTNSLSSTIDVGTWYKTNEMEINLEYLGNQEEIAIIKAQNRDSSNNFSEASFANHKVNILLNTNGGNIEEETVYHGSEYNEGDVFLWQTDADGIIYRKHDAIDNDYTKYFFSINYGSKIKESGLPNYNNKDYMKITQEGYTAKSKNEWICIGGDCVKGTTYNQTSSAYSSNDFCYVLEEDCTAILGVNWTPVDYTITYDLAGGSVSGNPTDYNIESNAITLKNPTKTGYTFMGWTGSNGTIPSKSVTIPKGSTGNKTYTANWQANKVYIKFNVNGGEIQETAIYNANQTYYWDTPEEYGGTIFRTYNGTKTEEFFSINYNERTPTSGLPNYNNSTYMNITKTGYSAVGDAEWKCLSGNCNKDVYGHNRTYAASEFCDASSGDCTVTLGVNWQQVQVDTPTFASNDGKESGEWHNQNFNLSITSNKSNATIYYGTNSSNINTPYNGAITISSETNSTTYYAKACVSSTCSNISYYQVKLDKTAPALNVTVHNDSGSNITTYSGSTSWYKTRLYFSINATDTRSGLSTDHVIYDASEYGSKTQSVDYIYQNKLSLDSNNNTSITVSSDGNRKYKFTICDNAGNCSENKKNFKTDTTPPTVDVDMKYTESERTINLSCDGNSCANSNWLNDYVTLYFNSSDSLSGLNNNATFDYNAAYSSSDKTLLKINESASLNNYGGWKRDISGDGNRYVTLKVCDNVNNCTTKNVNFKIDTQAPVITLSKNESNNLYFQCNSLSGIKMFITSDGVSGSGTLQSDGVTVKHYWDPSKTPLITLTCRSNSEIYANYNYSSSNSGCSYDLASAPYINGFQTNNICSSEATVCNGQKKYTHCVVANDIVTYRVWGSGSNSNGALKFIDSGK